MAGSAGPKERRRLVTLLLCGLGEIASPLWGSGSWSVTCRGWISLPHLGKAWCTQEIAEKKYFNIGSMKVRT